MGIPAADEKSKNAYVNTFLDLSKMIDGGYFSAQGWGGQILEKVTYTDDIDKLEPKILNIPVMNAIVNEQIKAQFESVESSAKASDIGNDDRSGYMI